MSTPIYNPDRPFGILRMTTYKRVVESFEEAVGILRRKKLVYGEPAAVPYYHRDRIMLAVGIGTPDINKPLILTNFSVEDEHRFGDNIGEDCRDRHVVIWNEYKDEDHHHHHHHHHHHCPCEDDYWEEYDDGESRD